VWKNNTSRHRLALPLFRRGKTEFKYAEIRRHNIPEKTPLL
jgi:hypothetical protein